MTDISTQVVTAGRAKEKIIETIGPELMIEYYGKEMKIAKHENNGRVAYRAVYRNGTPGVFVTKEEAHRLVYEVGYDRIMRYDQDLPIQRVN